MSERPKIRKRPVKDAAPAEPKKRGRPRIHPVKERRERLGRPPFEASYDQREKVEILKLQGMSDEDIARVIGVSPDTLRKHFPEEIKGGRAKRLAEVKIAQFRIALAGNASAQKAVIARAELEAADESVRNRGAKKDDAPPAPRPAKLGKKEERQQAAEAVSGKYAPPAPPRLVIANS